MTFAEHILNTSLDHSKKTFETAQKSRWRNFATTQTENILTPTVYRYRTHSFEIP